MTAKQSPQALQAPDGSYYVTLTDGAGNLAGSAVGPSGGSQVEGTIASGATDSGNPVKVGGKYNSTIPTFTNGQRGDVQLSANGSVNASVRGLGTSGADAVSNANGAGIQDDATSTTFGRPLLVWPHVFNGTTWDRVRGSTTGLSVIGPFADGTAVGTHGLPTVLEGRTTNKTAVTTGQYVKPIATTIGAAINKPYQVPELDWSFASVAGGMTTTADTTLVAAAGAGIRNYLTGISIQNASATVSTEVVIKDGATVIWRGFLGIGSLLNSAVGLTFPSPLKTTANTALNVACITTASQIYVNAQGYQAP